MEKTGLSNGRRKNGAWEGIIEKTSRVTNSGMNEPSEKWVTGGIRSQSLPKKLVGRNATVKVGQFALHGWSNAPIPVLIDNILWVVSVKTTNEVKARTNDGTALCEGNVAISDDGCFSQRMDV
jgi:hypothetical protein